MGKYLVGGVVALVLVVALSGAYFWGRGKLPDSSATPVPQPTTVSQTTAVASASPSPDTAQKEDAMVGQSKTIAQIEASIASKNTQALESYMASSVNVVIYATECCGPLTALAATKQLDYLSSATPPWNFKDNNPIAAQLRAKSDFFKDATVIGTASNGYAVGFTLDDQAKIKSVALVADYKLITQ